MVTKEYSSAPKAENNPMEKFETILQAGNRCLNNVSFSQVMTISKKRLRMSSLDSLEF